MTLDLITERNVERFMELADLRACPISTAMQWCTEEHQTFLTFRSGRMHISQCLLQHWLDDELLQRALLTWQPARFAGVPQRFFLLHCGMVISCSPAAESGAELWLFLYRRQRAFLETLCKPT